MFLLVAFGMDVEHYSTKALRHVGYNINPDSPAVGRPRPLRMCISYRHRELRRRRKRASRPSCLTSRAWWVASCGTSGLGGCTLVAGTVFVCVFEGEDERAWLWFALQCFGCWDLRNSPGSAEREFSGFRCSFVGSGFRI